MNCYETMVIFDGRIEDDKYKPCVDHYIEKITRRGGLIRAVDKMGKKKLACAYKRDGIEIREAWYARFIYKGLPELIAKLEEEFRKDDIVLKYLTVRMSEEAEYTEVDTGEELYNNPESNSVESEQSSDIAKDSWDLIFDFERGV